MRTLAATFLVISSITANAAGVNMDDPARALGREDDIRVDAQLVQDTLAPGVPVAVTYQIQNLTETAVAVADKVSSATYDSDTRTIMVTIGSEVPQQTMPHVVV